MNEKVILPREIAETLDHYRKSNLTNADIIYLSLGTNGTIDELLSEFCVYSFDVLLSALVNGYTVNPEEYVIELFTELSANPTNDEYTFGVIDGIKDTLTLLGIKIEGVNA
jgi:hypothetical protein